MACGFQCLNTIKHSLSGSSFFFLLCMSVSTEWFVMSLDYKCWIETRTQYMYYHHLLKTWFTCIKDPPGKSSGRRMCFRRGHLQCVVRKTSEQDCEIAGRWNRHCQPLLAQRSLDKRPSWTTARDQPNDETEKVYSNVVEKQTSAGVLSNCRQDVAIVGTASPTLFWGSQYDCKLGWIWRGELKKRCVA